MMVNYNMKDRTSFVKALVEITGANIKYLYTPSYAFEVGIFTVTCEGNLVYDDAANPTETERVIKEFGQKGYNAERPEDTGLTILLPPDCVNIDITLTTCLQPKAAL